MLVLARTDYGRFSSTPMYIQDGVIPFMLVFDPYMPEKFAHMQRRFEYSVSNIATSRVSLSHRFNADFKEFVSSVEQMIKHTTK